MEQMGIGAIIFAADNFSKEQIVFKPSFKWVYDEIKKSISDIFVLGEEQASEEALEFAQSKNNIVMLAGNMPLLNGEIMKKALKEHTENNCLFTVISGRKCGCIVNKSLIKEFFSSVEETISELEKQTEPVVYNVKDEYYIKNIEDNFSYLDINQAAANKVIDKHLSNGVKLLSRDGVLISPDVQIEGDAVIMPNTILKGNTIIGKNSVIGPGSLIENCTVGENSVINATQCYDSVIHSDVKIGPFCHIRPNSEIKSKVKIGDFVEVKNSVVGEGTAISHLTYIGDSDVGKNVNFGCGVVTVNYDGVNKFRTVVEDEAFVGCNTNLVAPVTVGKGSYTAAGSTITKNVPSKALGIARARQENKENFAAKKLKNRKLKV